MGAIPTRATIWLMVLTACMMSYMLRVNMSINLIAMIETSSKATSDLMHLSNLNESSSEENSTLNNLLEEIEKMQDMQEARVESECIAINQGRDNETHAERLTQLPNYGSRYHWSQQVQGLILGSFFWGYIVSSMPGGLLAEKCGPTRIIFISILLSSILTILTPLAASLHYTCVIAIRILLGLLGGVVYPALHCLISKWAPPVEKGKFIGALMGGTLGTVITWPMLGAIIEHVGWAWAFFIPGGLSLIWCFLWLFLVSDCPEVSQFISEEEKLMILKSLNRATSTQFVSNETKVKTIPPYKQIFSSSSFWALCVLHFGNLWGLYLLLTAGPKFMSEVLGFNLGHSGILASLPYLARMILGLVFGSLGDLIRKRQLIGVTSIRKSFILFSHFIPALFLIAQTLIGCDQTLAVLFLTLALGMNGASTVTNLQNAQDLSPNYAGSLYGIVNCIGGTTGFITPMLTGLLTEHRNGLHEWHCIFWIGAGVYTVCGVVFIGFGSGEIQSWNTAEQILPEEIQTVEKTAQNKNGVLEGVANQGFKEDTDDISKPRNKQLV